MLMLPAKESLTVEFKSEQKRLNRMMKLLTT